jgi:hypothetical protein
MAIAIENARAAFVDEMGNVAFDSAEEFAKIWNATITGGNMQDWASAWAAMIPGFTAQVRNMQRQARYQEEVSTPANFYRSTLSQPIMPASYGVQPSFGTSTFGGPLSNVGISSSFIRQNQALVDEQEALRAQGREKTFDLIMRGRGLEPPTLGPTPLTLDITKPITQAADGAKEWAQNAADVRKQMAEIEGISKRIADLQIGDASARQAMQQEQYNEQLRISVRGAGDALGLAGKLRGVYRQIVEYQEDGSAITKSQVVEATRYGQLQRAQISDQRQVTNIQLARSQRELNLQLALSRLRAPGETAAERAVRRREAEALAKEQQQVLDINKRSTRRGFVIQDIQLSRNANDVMKQLELMTGQRALQIKLEGSQSLQHYLSRSRALKEEILGIGISLGESTDKTIMSTRAKIEAQTGEYRDTFTQETEDLMGIVLRAQQKIYQRFMKTVREENKTVGTGTGSGAPPIGAYIPKGGAPQAGAPQGTADDSQHSGLRYSEVKQLIAKYYNMATTGGDQLSDEEVKRYVRDRMEGHGVSRNRTNQVATRNGYWATGGVFQTAGATSFIAGEAGSESVIVIRNPKLGMTSGGTAPSSGGGGKSIKINIDINASVRDDRDVDALVRKVVREIHNQSELIV